jgi:fused signal recognition particle receptor
MADTKPDKPGFLSRLFGRKAEAPAPAPEFPQAGGEPEAMPSPPATAADDLTAAPPTVTDASPDTAEENKVPPELAGADLQPVEGLDPEGTNPQEPLPRIVTETGPELRPDMAAADLRCFRLLPREPSPPRLAAGGSA